MREIQRTKSSYVFFVKREGARFAQNLKRQGNHQSAKRSNLRRVSRETKLTAFSKIAVEQSFLRSEGFPISNSDEGKFVFLFKNIRYNHFS